MKRSTKKAAEARAVSATELGRLLRRHRNTVSDWIADGCPVVARARRDEGSEHRLDPSAVVDWLVRRAREEERAKWQPRVRQLEHALAAGPGEGDHDGSLEEAKRRRAVALARTAEVEAQRREGEVLPRRPTIRAFVGILVRVRDRILTCPQRWARELAVVDEPTEIRSISDRELRAALEELADPERIADTIRRSVLETDDENDS